MKTNDNSTRLENVLWIDAVTCVSMGLVLTSGGSLLQSLTGIPAALSLYAGLALFPIAAFMVLSAKRWLRGAWAVHVIVIGNGLWVAASLALVVGPWIEPNTLGIVFILFQAWVVLSLAVVEFQAASRVR